MTTMREDARPGLGKAAQTAPDETVRELSRRLQERNAEAYDALAFDYTRWQQERFDDVDLDEFNAAAAAWAKKHSPLE